MPTPLSALVSLAVGLLFVAEPPPESVRADAEAAVAAGRLRLFGSVSAGRLRVALVDEDERVGLVHAFAVLGEEKRMLPRLDTTAADRIEFALDTPPGARATIRIEAYQRHRDPPILVHAIELEAPPPLPVAPAPKATAPALGSDEDARLIPWWLIVGAVVATTLAGFAVYQEID